MTWLAYQDGDKFYIQDDPKSESSISCFDSMKQADEFCEFLNKKSEDKILVNNNCPKCDSSNTVTVNHDYADASHIEINKCCDDCKTDFAISYDFTNGVKYLE